MFIKFVDIDCFLCNSYPCALFESLSHVINQESNVNSWNLGRFVSFIFWNFEIYLVSFGRFQNFKKVNSLNLSQIYLLNMCLLIQIEWFQVLVWWSDVFMGDFDFHSMGVQRLDDPSCSMDALLGSNKIFSCSREQ